MSYDLIFLLEEPSIKNVLDQLLPQVIPTEITYICIPHQGKQDLANWHWISLIKRQKEDRERIRENEILLLSLRKGRDFARQMVRIQVRMGMREMEEDSIKA
jgi:hypothetical protein